MKRTLLPLLLTACFGVLLTFGGIVLSDNLYRNALPEHVQFDAVMSGQAGAQDGPDWKALVGSFEGDSDGWKALVMSTNPNEEAGDSWKAVVVSFNPNAE